MDAPLGYSPLPTGRGRRALGTARRLTFSRLVARPLLAALAVFGMWNITGYHLSTWINITVQRGWQPDGLPANTGPIWCTLLTLALLIVLAYVVRKAWSGIGVLTRVLTLGLIVAINVLAFAYLGQHEWMKTPAALITLAQISLFGLLWFGLSRAELDRRLSGTTTVSQIDPHEHVAHHHG